MASELKVIDCVGYKLTNHRVHCRRGVMWLGQTCNLRCKFCYFADRIANSDHPEHAFMSLEKAKMICKTLVEEYGNNSIDIQGGEPTIYPGIYELVRYCSEIGLKPTLITNALVLDKIEICQKLKDAGLFDLLVSVHALGDSYDELVQVPGASARQMKALDNFKLIGIPFRVNTVLSHDAVTMLADIARIAQEKGARAVNFIAFNPFIDQADGKRSAENIPRYAKVAETLLPIIDFLDQHQIEVNIRYLPFCIFPEKYRKYVQNFQQIIYDLHEWESASEVWSGAAPQRHSKEQLSSPVRFYDRIAQIRETRFRDKVEQKQGYPLAVERLLDQLQMKFTASTNKPLRVAFFGNAGVGQRLCGILNEHSFWKTRWQMYGYISSRQYHQSDTLNGAPWYCDDQLALDPPDVIITTTDSFIPQIHTIIEQYGLRNKTLDYFGNYCQTGPYKPLFYLDELGEVDGFSALDYAYKEYRIWMTKTVHPYTKGERCQQCSLCGICDGFHRDYAEIFGFDEASSIKLPEKIYDPRFYMADQLKVVEEQEYSWALPIDAKRYTKMQKNFYDMRAVTVKNAKELVHPNYDMASSQAIASLSYVLQEFAERTAVNLHGNTFKEILQQLLPLKTDLKLLDFGCGIGRLMQPLAESGFQVDGADISSKMLSFAKQNKQLTSSRFFLTDGADCGNAPLEYYDIVYSQICMQHIASRAIRRKILESIAGILKSGGMFSIQFHYYPNIIASEVPKPHVAWDVNDYEAKGTNSEADVWITPDALPLVLEDFREFFRDIRLQFIEFPIAAKLYTKAYGTWFDHLIISGSKGYSLAERVYHVLDR
ncbi:MAG: radical SAM protein [Deltaproteobacteria bacterium]|nr:radical SAM protein [Deltaproteobacteria bacterium]